MLLLATADYNIENGVVNISYAKAEKRYRSNDSNNNNKGVSMSGSEFRTISLGIHAELAKLRIAMETPDKRMHRAQTPRQKETALDIARQITNLSPDPLFITVGNNGADMCVSVFFRIWNFGGVSQVMTTTSPSPPNVPCTSLPSPPFPYHSPPFLSLSFSLPLEVEPP